MTRFRSIFPNNRTEEEISISAFHCNVNNNNSHVEFIRERFRLIRYSKWHFIAKILRVASDFVLQYPEELDNWID